MAILGPFDFHGGYTPGYDFTVLPQGHSYATTMKDVRIKSGQIVPRWSTTPINFTPPLTGAGKFAGSILGLTTWRDTVNSAYAIIATIGSGNQLRISSDMSAYLPEAGQTITFTDRTGALAAASINGLTTFDSLNNILIGSSNSASSGAVFKVTAYNANGAALGGSPPSADCVKQVNNFLFLSRNLSSTTTQSNVYWSNVNDPETWTAANVLAFSKNDGEPVMALGSIGTDLYIFKQSSIGRLSTTTITTSGAVTLGPLTTVIKGVGCCGPRALDNLPNGNIVFVAYSGHVYEFDGSTLRDLCDEPYPGPSAFNLANYNATQTVALTFCTPDVNVSVKTCRGLKEVWIAYTTSLYAAGPKTFAYNYEERAWNGNPNANAFSLTTFQLPGTYSAYQIESPDFIVHGTSISGGTSGNIYSNGNSTRPYPTDDSAASPTVATTFQIGTTIQLGQDGAAFIPRSLCVETRSTQGVASTPVMGTFSISADFDTYLASTAIYTQTVFPLPTRLIVPLTFKQDAVGNNIFPSFLSVLFSASGTGSNPAAGVNIEILRLGKFWVSDEVVR